MISLARAFMGFSHVLRTESSLDNLLRRVLQPHSFIYDGAFSENNAKKPFTFSEKAPSYTPDGVQNTPQLFTWFYELNHLHNAADMEQPFYGAREPLPHPFR